jgi:cytoskeletal protein RodZ
MESFGQYLKSLREERGKTLEEISQSTKIAIISLEFLEKDRYELLPPRVFVKGFIRAYVEYLGVSPEEVLRYFDKFTQVGEVPNYEGEEHPVFPRAKRPLSFIGSPVFSVVLTSAGVICLVILLLTAVVRLFKLDGIARTKQPTVATVKPSRGPTIVSDNEPVQTPARTTRGAQRSQSGKKVLEIKAVSTAWVRVQPDTGPAEELVMSAGDSQPFFANESFQVQTGNAGGLRFRLDGKEYPVLGKDNQTLTLTIP